MEPTKQVPVEELRRRVFVPIERRNLDGTYTFRTSDKEKYIRLPNGQIRRAVPKPRRQRKG